MTSKCSTVDDGNNPRPALVKRSAQPAQPESRQSDRSAASPRTRLERILIRLNERYLVVRSEDIDWIEAAANYVVLHAKSGNHVLRKTLSALEKELCNQQFFRVSRSSIVNLDRVSEIWFEASGEHTVVLTTGAKTPLTRGLRELQERLQFLR